MLLTLDLTLTPSSFITSPFNNLLQSSILMLPVNVIDLWPCPLAHTSPIPIKYVFCTLLVQCSQSVLLTFDLALPSRSYITSACAWNTSSAAFHFNVSSQCYWPLTLPCPLARSSLLLRQEFKWVAYWPIRMAKWLNPLWYLRISAFLGRKEFESLKIERKSLLNE